VVRHQADHPDVARRSSDDLEALADAVREAARPASRTQAPAGAGETGTGRRGHLRALPTPG
jgi:hypothetical protein